MKKILHVVALSFVIVVNIFISGKYLLEQTQTTLIVQAPQTILKNDSRLATVIETAQPQTKGHSNTDEETGETFATGELRPTDEQLNWAEKNVIKTKKVKLNEIGLARVNEEREKRGKIPLKKDEVEFAPIGQEVVGAANDNTQPSATGATELASSVDNSALKYFPPIRSQGSLNSCAQFSAVYYTMSHMNALANNFDAKTGGDAFRFSPKWTYNFINGGSNIGSWHYEAYIIAQKHGLATWEQFPYDSNYRAWSTNPDTWRNALSVRANTVGKVVDVDTDTGLSQLKQLLNNGYVLNHATYINSWVWGTIGNDPSTSADDTIAGKKIVTGVNGTNGGHSMTIVGYNDTIWIDLNTNGVVETNEKGALRIANSWGTSWGEAGFTWVSYQALKTRNPARTNEGLFWYDEATWVTMRSNYSPKMIAEFTLSHLRRSEITMSLGLGATTASKPSIVWKTNRILAGSGGPYAFDGTTIEKSGTFYLDFTDLIPTTNGTHRYFLDTFDTTLSNPTKLLSFNLIDLVNEKTLSYNTLPKNIDATEDYSYIDYDFSSGNIAPVATFTTNTTNGFIPLSVFFDSTGSQDLDGTITSYSWNFGDNTTATTPIVEHRYTKAGIFTATLTITDNKGSSVSTSKQITVIDPNVINPPGSLSATVSQKTVTLRWADLSLNETHFTIERATKTKNGVSAYTPVGTVAANATTFIDIANSGTHYYRVKAINSTTGSESAYSNILSVRVR